MANPAPPADVRCEIDGMWLATVTVQGHALCRKHAILVRRGYQALPAAAPAQTQAPAGTGGTTTTTA